MSAGPQFAISKGRASRARPLWRWSATARNRFISVTRSPTKRCSRRVQQSSRRSTNPRRALPAPPTRGKRTSRNCSRSDALASFSNIFTPKALARVFILLLASATGTRANLLFTKRLPLVICVSERSLLPVFVEAKDRSSFAIRFQEQVRLVLECVGVPSYAVEREAEEVLQVALGLTAYAYPVVSANR